MPVQPRVSPECVEMLQTWITAHCPGALQDGEFLPGLFVIVEEEVAKALREQDRQSVFQFFQPSNQ